MPIGQLRMADSGQDPRPSPSALFQPRGKLRRFDAIPPRGHCSRHQIEPPTCSASSLITAAAAPAGLSARAFAQFELQAPAVLAPFRIRPHFDGSDFRQPRAELHGHQSLAGFSESQNGMERRVQMRLAFDRMRPGMSTTSPILSSSLARTIQSERHGLVGDQLQIPGSISIVEPSSVPRGTRHMPHSVVLAPPNPMK